MKGLRQYRLFIRLVVMLLPVCDSNNPGQLMIHEVVGVLEYRIRGREKLDEVADSIPNTDRDDPEHEKGDQ